MLLSTLKELKHENQYRAFQRFVCNLKRKKTLIGKEKFILRCSTAYLNRLQAGRRARTLGLVDFVSYNERGAVYGSGKGIGDFRSWDRTVRLFSRDCS